MRTCNATDPDHVRRKASGEILALSLVSTKIAIYKDRVQGWFLDYIDKLKDDNDSGYVRLALATAQIEGMEQYRQGRSTRGCEGPMFKTAVTRIFQLPPTAGDAIEQLWSGLRCGLFHDGFTKGAVYLSEQYLGAAERDAPTGILKVNPRMFADAVIKDCRDYLETLIAGTSPQLVHNFETMWDDAWKHAKSCWAVRSTP